MKSYLLAPGPTNVPERFLKCLSEDLEHHRTSKFDNLVQENEKKINAIVNNTNGRSFVLTASGSAALEAIAQNFTKPKDTVLAINIGYFSELFASILKSADLNVIELRSEWGKTVDAEIIERTIQNNPEITHIFAVQSETSTGVLNDLESIGKIAKKYKLFFGVDAISGLLFNPLHMTQWGIDAVAGASQKGFNLPPGVSFVSFSQYAYENFYKAKATNNWYFNLGRYFKYSDPFKSLARAVAITPQTPAISMIRCLGRSLDEILKQGLVSKQKNQVKKYQYLEKKLLEIGFENVVRTEKHKSRSLIVVKNDTINLQDFLDTLFKDSHIYIANALTFWEKTAIRIGLLSELDEYDLDHIIQRMALAVRKVKMKAKEKERD
ncbi:alanine--glyoxylate aminotransferase family protein [Mycoplasmopsis agassizii]|uniref:pyridoxal-phosphate-dependent aminotransferase family protein n=1 Tax=Mycoplasmopsis agassizii TaxID=33922 RepID=UPI0035276D14